MNPSSQAGRAEAIIRADETLLTVYMLRVAARADWPGFSEESAARFLLWFAFEGRHSHHQVSISPEYLAFLADATPPFATRLMGYVFLKDEDARLQCGRDIAAFGAWYYAEGVDRHRLGPLVSGAERLALTERHGAPWATIVPLHAPSMPLGVNIIGFANGVLGLGEDARMMASALLRAGLHVAVVDIPLDGRRVTSTPQGWDTLMVERPIFPVSIFCLPPFEMMRLKVEKGLSLFHTRRNIGCWPWELTRLPDEWQNAFEAIDEIWAISPFLADVYGRLTEKPVRPAPPHVGLSAVETVSRAELGLEGEDIVILSMFDLNSFIARKNPEGAVAAFQQAFPNREGRERLIIKTLNGAANPELLASLMALAETDQRIRIIDGAWPRGRTLGLIAAANMVLSLHRAEGFGRILAEAMLLGVPVVATAWSGALSYLSAETGWPVSCKPRAVRQGEYIYPEGSFWAEPDITAAAEALTAVVAQPAEAARRAEVAREHIHQQHGLDAVALHLARLLSSRAA